MQKINRKDFRAFTGYLKPYYKLAILAPLFMVLEVIMDLMQPKLLSRIVDHGIMMGNMDLIIKTGFMMIVVAVIGMIGGIGCTIFSTIASQNFGHDLRKDMFKRILDFSPADIDRFTPSSLITRLTNDINQVQQLVLMSLRLLVRGPLLCIGGIVMAFIINFELSLIILVLIPLLLFIFFKITKKSFHLFSIVQQKIDRLNLVVRENLSGIRLIRIFNRQEYEKQRFYEANRNLATSLLQAINVVIKIGPIVMLIINAGILSILWFGGKMYLAQRIEIGEIMAFISYLLIIMMSLVMVSNFFIFISRAGASIERINEIFKIKQRREDIHYKEIEIKGNVEFRNVFFDYEKDKNEPLLKNICFSVEQGETVGIIGKTGSGKTTLLNLIVGLYTPLKGEVLIDNVPVKEISPEILRKNTGYVSQNVFLFSGTIREIIAWGKPDASDEEIKQAAKIAMMYDFILSLPDGFDTYIGEKGINLSGGQRQRLTIAAAIIKKPKILIFDDCTSSVDLLTEKNIFSNLKKIGKCTTFIVTPRIFSIMDADKIIVIEDGTIAGIGTHQELLETCRYYREVVESQTGEKINA